ncbi:hypothetical protein [Thermoleptolyngbya sp. M55_K2018_002]|uniref:hypothetical protein n=1 Tax=Thermoleptolyngbya sp. M55_K2018_002 TaxID=2747808 RepID=UPI0019FFF960|nr:hypothetical protein [Thermoleptolyngbya sp. M55_K2018_002]HIK42137.1 hypothetical protein [Thermoleptolyngbya sp. M55_K2018_002]
MLSEQQWRRLKETSDAQRKDPQNRDKHSAFVAAIHEAGRSLGVPKLNSYDAWNRIIDRLDELRPDWRGYVPDYVGYAVSKSA